MSNPKSHPDAPIEEILAEIQQILDEGQSRAPLHTGATVAPVAARASTPPPCADAKANPQPCGGARTLEELVCDFLRPITLEDIVGDLLRPMLRSWFDENLPSLIEREMQAETCW